MNQPIDRTSTESIEQICDRFLGYVFRTLHRIASDRGIPFEQVRAAVAASVVAYLAWNPTQEGKQP